MRTVHEIETAIEQLSEQEVAEIKSWLFDRDIARDSGSGLLDSLVDEAIAEARSGRVRSL